MDITSAEDRKPLDVTAGTTELSSAAAEISRSMRIAIILCSGARGYIDRQKRNVPSLHEEYLWREDTLHRGLLRTEIAAAGRWAREVAAALRCHRTVGAKSCQAWSTLLRMGRFIRSVVALLRKDGKC